MGAEIPAETEFITSAVRPEPAADRMETLVARNPNWEQVVREAVNRHRVGPLLHRNLTESGSTELIPEQVVERLRQHSRQTATRNLSLTNALLSILENFREREIPALPYKGPVLSESIYADFSLRQSRDLDILVRPDDIHDAEAVLLERGFEPKFELTEKQKRLLVKNGRHRTMKKGGTIVELHPRISSFDPPFEVADLLDRAGSVDLAGESVPTTRPVDTLFALSVHGTTHQWNQLKWICDVAYLIKNETFDWPAVLEESKRRNCYRRVLLGCGLASTVLNVGLSEVVRSGLRNTEPRLVSDTYPDCLLGTDGTTSLRYRLRSRDDNIDRIRYCWKKITTPSFRGTENLPILGHRPGLNHKINPIREIISKLIAVVRNFGSKIRTDVK